MTETAGDRAQRLVSLGLELACAVREDPRETICARICAIDSGDKDALIVTLAALVDIDQPAEQLLSWVTWDEHGSSLKAVRRKAGSSTDPLLVAHAAYARAKSRREAIPDWALEGERNYQRRRHRKNRAVA